MQAKNRKPDHERTRKRNRETERVAYKRYLAKLRTDPVRLEAFRAKKRLYAKINRAQKRLCEIRWRYGLTEEQYEVLLVQQDARCAICKEPFIETPSVDHDPKTEIVRGLLCRGCNTGLGLFRHLPQHLRAAAVYLEANLSK